MPSLVCGGKKESPGHGSCESCLWLRFDYFPYYMIVDITDRYATPSLIYSIFYILLAQQWGQWSSFDEAESVTKQSIRDKYHKQYSWNSTVIHCTVQYSMIIVCTAITLNYYKQSGTFQSQKCRQCRCRLRACMRPAACRDLARMLGLLTNQNIQA